jgi:hypothetical protein
MVRVGDRSPIPQATVDKLRLPVKTPEEASLPSLVAFTWLNVVKREHTQSAQLIRRQRDIFSCPSKSSFLETGLSSGMQGVVVPIGRWYQGDA